MMPLLEIYDETNFKYTLTVICSKKGSGKSTLLVKLLLDPRAYKGKYDRIIIVSSTFRAQYNTLWNKLNQQGIEVHDEVSEELLKTIQDFQEANDDKNVLVISDDQGENWRSIDKKLMSLFISNSRHMRCSMIFLVQKFTQISPVIRTQADCIISFSSASSKQLEALAAEVNIMDLKSFRKMFYDVTQQDFHFLICVTLPKIEYFHNFEKIDITKYQK